MNLITVFFTENLIEFGESYMMRFSEYSIQFQLTLHYQLILIVILIVIMLLIMLLMITL